MERRLVVELWQALKMQGAPGVLVTLVNAEGSSYRRAGARLLVDAEGHYAGTISGGCLESEVVRRAMWLTRNGAALKRYSTAFDDTTEIPFGLGCGGTVDLLLERLDTDEAKAMMAALESALGGQDRIAATWLPAREDAAGMEEGIGLRRAIWSATGELLFSSDTLQPVMLRDAFAGRLAGVFLERLDAPQRLFVLGAGDDAKPLVSMASLLGWSVTVLDGRPQLARVERFAAGTSVVCATSVDDLAARPLERRDAVVIMSHSFEQDRAWLQQVLPRAPRYLGLLGARHRSSLLVQEVAVELGLPVETCCERIYAPVGLDLGGDGPEAIALAVMAEAQACCMGKIGISRRLTPEMVAAFAEDRAPARAAVACGLDAMTVEAVTA